MARARTNQQTGMIRVPADLSEMLGWLYRLARTDDEETVADIVEPLIRPTVEERYARIASRVEIIKAAESGEPLPGHAPDLGENGGA